MASIFDIDDWQSNTFYKKNSIVKSNGLYYYAAQAHTSNIGTFATDFNGGLWNGTATDDKGETKPFFFWNVAFGTSITPIFTTKVIRFGEGYEQRVRDGINNVLLSADVAIDGKNLDEVSAIAHFLMIRNGVESFLWVPPAPYNKRKLFVCDEFPTDFIFFNNNSIRATFREVVN